MLEWENRNGDSDVVDCNPSAPVGSSKSAINFYGLTLAATETQKQKMLGVKNSSICGVSVHQVQSCWDLDRQTFTIALDVHLKGQALGPLGVRRMAVGTSQGRLLVGTYLLTNRTGKASYLKPGCIEHGRSAVPISTAIVRFGQCQSWFQPQAKCAEDHWKLMRRNYFKNQQDTDHANLRKLDWKTITQVHF